MLKNIIILGKTIIIIFVFILLVNINLYAQNLKIKYFEVWNKYTLLQFYNEIPKDSLNNYKYYYKVTFDSKDRILKFEYFINGVVEFAGEVAIFSDSFVTLTLKKLETQLMATQPVLVAYAMYELTLKNNQIVSYILYKASPNLEKPIKIGEARFSYQQDLIIVENIFNNKVIMKIEIKCDDKNLIEMNFFNEKNLLVEQRLFKNNKLEKRIVYKYDSNGKLIQIITYDSAGQIISVEDK